MDWSHLMSGLIGVLFTLLLAYFKLWRTFVPKEDCRAIHKSVVGSIKTAVENVRCVWEKDRGEVMSKIKKHEEELSRADRARKEIHKQLNESNNKLASIEQILEYMQRDINTLLRINGPGK